MRKALDKTQRRIVADALRAAVRTTRERALAASEMPPNMRPPQAVLDQLQDSLRTLAANQERLLADFDDRTAIVFVERKDPK